MTGTGIAGVVHHPTTNFPPFTQSAGSLLNLIISQTNQVLTLIRCTLDSFLYILTTMAQAGPGNRGYASGSGGHSTVHHSVWISSEVGPSLGPLSRCRLERCFVQIRGNTKMVRLE